MAKMFLGKHFPSSMVTKLRKEITNFHQRPDESLFEAWERYKLSIDRCPNHNILPVTQIDTFYNGLTLKHRDTINAATGGTFMKRHLEECYDVIENMTAQHNDWDTSVQRTITTRSGLVIDGPTVPTPSRSINLEEDECVEETFTDPDLAEYTIKQEKDEVQIHKFWQMFKQLHINITLTDALILMPKYQKMLKALLSNKEKLQELVNTPLNENCSAVILKKLPEKLGDPGKFLIPCGFSELKCKALADLGASINLMPLFIWKKLGLPELIPTRMTFELANHAIFTPVGIARDVFISVGKFTFPADFVIVDYESDPRVPLILGRPFLRTARALIDVHDKEMILRD
nr:reverse transcriptase domain-containing protein [Tanacetum cinerariifolium]